MSEMEQEEWRGIPGFPDYEVSSIGRVRSNDRVSERGRRLPGRTLRQTNMKIGYKMVHLYPGVPQHVDAYVHRLVLLAFCGPAPEGHLCRHLDGDRKNNRRENLAWGTPSENVADTIAHGRMPRGEQRAHSKLNDFKVRAMLALLHQGCAIQKAADLFEVSFGLVQLIASGKRWTQVPRPDGFVTCRKPRRAKSDAGGAPSPS